MSYSITTQAVLDGLGARVHELELKWGRDRMRLLVDDGLRARFDQQQQLLADAVAADDQEQIVLHAQAMRRGWEALDAAATEAGAFPLSPRVWECVLPDGEVVSIVRTEAEAIHVAREGEVYSLSEVGKMIDRLGRGIRGAKTMYSGTIAEIRAKDPVTLAAQEREAYVDAMADRFEPDQETPF
jgi:hypothetical protein